MKLDLGKNWLQLSLSGEIDVAWLEQHKDEIDALCEDLPAAVVVDVQQVTFMDSTGPGLLARLAHECRPKSHGSVYLVGASTVVVKSLQAIGLDRYVTVVNTSEGSQALHVQLSALEAITEAKRGNGTGTVLRIALEGPSLSQRRSSINGAPAGQSQTSERV